MSHIESRYNRQIRIPAIGAQGQERLSKAKVLCVGAGGLGSAMLYAITAAGVGSIGVVDDDVVHISNLNRQFLYCHDDIGALKVDCAINRLRALNPAISFTGYAERCNASNVERIVQDYDCIVDCGDNHYTSLLLNDWSYYFGKLFIFASLSQFSGMLGLYDGVTAPCLRCWNTYLPHAGQDCSVDGILGSVSAIFGSMQANEVIKSITGQSVRNTLTLFDTCTWQIQRLQVEPVDGCSACSLHARPQDTMLEIQVNDTFNVQDWIIIDIRADAQKLRSWVHRCSAADVLARSAAEWKQDKRVLLVCQKGVQSLVLTTQLRARGFTQVYSLAGGVGGIAFSRLLAQHG